MPDNGIILNDNLRGLYGSTVRLPFTDCTIEYYRSKNLTDEEKAKANDDSRIQTVRKWLILAKDYDDSEFIHFAVFGYFNKSKLWKNNILLGAINKKHPCNDKGITYGTSKLFNDIECSKEDLNSFEGQIFASANVILEFIEALSCKNVEACIHQAASPKNAQRIKSHKLPIYETKFLTIKTSSDKESVGMGMKGSHASPRQHLRRGHIRRLESGNIWINSCVVGDGSIGRIEKQYRVNTV